MVHLGKITRACGRAVSRACGRAVCSIISTFCPPAGWVMSCEKINRHKRRAIQEIEQRYNEILSQNLSALENKFERNLQFLQQRKLELETQIQANQTVMAAHYKEIELFLQQQKHLVNTPEKFQELLELLQCCAEGNISDVDIEQKVKDLEDVILAVLNWGLMHILVLRPDDEYHEKLLEVIEVIISEDKYSYDYRNLDFLGHSVLEYAELRHDPALIAKLEHRQMEFEYRQKLKVAKLWFAMPGRNINVQAIFNDLNLLVELGKDFQPAQMQLMSSKGVVGPDSYCNSDRGNNVVITAATSEQQREYIDIAWKNSVIIYSNEHAKNTAPSTRIAILEKMFTTEQFHFSKIIFFLNHNPNYIAPGKMRELIVKYQNIPAIKQDVLRVYAWLWEQGFTGDLQTRKIKDHLYNGDTPLSAVIKAANELKIGQCQQKYLSIVFQSMLNLTTYAQRAMIKDNCNFVLIDVNQQNAAGEFPLQTAIKFQAVTMVDALKEQCSVQPGMLQPIHTMSGDFSLRRYQDIREYGLAYFCLMTRGLMTTTEVQLLISLALYAEKIATDLPITKLELPKLANMFNMTIEFVDGSGSKFYKPNNHQGQLQHVSIKIVSKDGKYQLFSAGKQLKTRDEAFPAIEIHPLLQGSSFRKAIDGMGMVSVELPGEELTIVSADTMARSLGINPPTIDNYSRERLVGDTETIKFNNHIVSNLIHKYVYEMPQDDCGYQALGISRFTAAKLLVNNIENEKVKIPLAVEFVNWIAGFLGSIPPVFDDPELVRLISDFRNDSSNDKTASTSALLKYGQKKEVLLKFIKNQVITPGSMVNTLRYYNASRTMPAGGVLVALANLYHLEINIFQLTETEELQQVFQYDARRKDLFGYSNDKTINILKTKDQFPNRLYSAGLMLDKEDDEIYPVPTHIRLFKNRQGNQDGVAAMLHGWFLQKIFSDNTVPHNDLLFYLLEAHYNLQKNELADSATLLADMQTVRNLLADEIGMELAAKLRNGGDLSQLPFAQEADNRIRKFSLEGLRLAHSKRIEEMLLQPEQIREAVAQQLEVEYAENQELAKATDQYFSEQLAAVEANYQAAYNELKNWYNTESDNMRREINSACSEEIEAVKHDARKAKRMLGAKIGADIIQAIAIVKFDGCIPQTFQTRVSMSLAKNSLTAAATGDVKHLAKGLLMDISAEVTGRVVEDVKIKNKLLEKIVHNAIRDFPGMAVEGRFNIENIAKGLFLDIASEVSEKLVADITIQNEVLEHAVHDFIKIAPKMAIKERTDFHKQFAMCMADSFTAYSMEHHVKFSNEHVNDFVKGVMEGVRDGVKKGDKDLFKAAYKGLNKVCMKKAETFVTELIDDKLSEKSVVRELTSNDLREQPGDNNNPPQPPNSSQCSGSQAQSSTGNSQQSQASQPSSQSQQEGSTQQHSIAQEGGNSRKLQQSSQFRQEGSAQQLQQAQKRIKNEGNRALANASAVGGIADYSFKKATGHNFPSLGLGTAMMDVCQEIQEQKERGNSTTTAVTNAAWNVGVERGAEAAVAELTGGTGLVVLEVSRLYDNNVPKPTEEDFKRIEKRAGLDEDSQQELQQSCANASGKDKFLCYYVLSKEQDRQARFDASRVLTKVADATARAPSQAFDAAVKPLKKS